MDSISDSEVCLVCADITQWIPSVTGSHFPLVPAITSPNPIDVDGVAAPGRSIVLHPGMQVEYAVLAWTAPHPGVATVSVTFTRLSNATTDVHLIDPLGENVMSAPISSNAPSSTLMQKMRVAASDKFLVAVGYGGIDYFGDSTQVSAQVRLLASY